MRRVLNRNVTAIKSILDRYDTGDGIVGRITFSSVRSTRLKNIFRVKWQANKPPLWVDIVSGAVSADWKDAANLRNNRGSAGPVTLAKIKAVLKDEVEKVKPEPQVTHSVLDILESNATIAGKLIAGVENIFDLRVLLKAETEGKNRKTVISEINKAIKAKS